MSKREAKVILPYSTHAWQDNRGLSAMENTKQNWLTISLAEQEGRRLFSQGFPCPKDERQAKAWLDLQAYYRESYEREAKA